MKKVTLYSRSGSAGAAGEPRAARPATPRAAAAAVAQSAEAPPIPARRNRWRATIARFERPLLVAAGGLFAVGLVWLHAALTPAAATGDAAQPTGRTMRTDAAKPGSPGGHA